MKKILLAFILVFSFFFSSVSAEIPDGFKGYAWGTDFWTVDKDVELYYFETRESGIGEHGGFSDTIYDSSGELAVRYEYHFYNNSLVEGAILFYDKTEFNSAVASLKNKLSRPPEKSHKGDRQFYFGKNTIIMIDPWDSQGKHGAIPFFDSQFIEEMIKKRTRTNLQQIFQLKD